MKKNYFKLLRLYSSLSDKEKYILFLKALKNDERGFDKKAETDYRLFSIINLCIDNAEVGKLKKELEIFFASFDYYVENVEFNEDNYVDLILKEINKINSNIDNIRVRGIALLFFLVTNGMLPLISYAFDELLFEKYFNMEMLEYIIQLSISYLYRLVNIKSKQDVSGEEKGRGAYCKVIVKDGTMYKIPLNIAALYYANPCEWENYKILVETDIQDYIPKYFSYDEKNGVIKKEYIYGNTGEYILNERGLSENEVKQLEIVYNNILKVLQDNGVLLDIHPNNFIWNEEKGKWYLVDLGENQYIGSDYYILDNFQNYYKKSWLEREMRKKKYPIRSVDL